LIKHRFFTKELLTTKLYSSKKCCKLCYSPRYHRDKLWWKINCFNTRFLFFRRF